MNLVFAYVTTKDRDEARQIGRALVDKKLAACVNFWDGMESIYVWEGKVESAKETVLIAKTEARHKEALTAVVKALHSYECPCVLFFDVTAGNEAYAKWIGDTLSRA